MVDVTHKIDPDGDVLLVVGKKSPEHLRVSSKVLSKASRVFKALFGPHFCEGQPERTSKNPVKITLPEDDISALVSVCIWLHSGVVQTKWTATGPLRVAITIDNYDCGDILQYHTLALLWDWLDQSGDWGSADTLGQIASAAYYLNHGRIFKKATSTIFKNRHVLNAAGDMPPKLYYMIQHRQMCLQNCFHTEIPNLMIPECCLYAYDEDDDEGVHEAMQKVCSEFNVRIWPPPKITPRTVEQTVMCLANQERARCICGEHDRILDPCDIDGFLGRLRGMCEGLCLPCSREQEVVDPMKICNKVAHAE